VALVLSAYDLVVRVADLPGGIAAFSGVVPNSTFCTDGTLARASFMTTADRDRFAGTLQVPPAAVARADRHPFSTDAAWLECGRYSGTDAVWLRDAPREPLVVPVRWAPSEVVFGSAEEAKEQLEYLGNEGNLEVYRDKLTGQKVYTGRTQPSLAPDELERLERLRTSANELISPLITRPQKPGFFEKRRLKKGAGLLEEVLATVPDHWPTLWTLGMALRALGEEEAALPRFRRAYELNSGQLDVGREYAGQCMRLGLANESVHVSRDLHARFPEDVSLHSNLGLALLIAGAVDEASSVAGKALERDPADPITRALVDYIGKVKAGKVPRPTRMPGM
jgi:tetratricopeptide (TPR) repeat protein